MNLRLYSVFPQDILQRVSQAFAYHGVITQASPLGDVSSVDSAHCVVIVSPWLGNLLYTQSSITYHDAQAASKLFQTINLLNTFQSTSVLFVRTHHTNQSRRTMEDAAQSLLSDLSNTKNIDGTRRFYFHVLWVSELHDLHTSELRFLGTVDLVQREVSLGRVWIQTGNPQKHFLESSSVATLASTVVQRINTLENTEGNIKKDVTENIAKYCAKQHPEAVFGFQSTRSSG